MKGKRCGKASSRPKAESQSFTSRTVIFEDPILTSQTETAYLASSVRARSKLRSETSISGFRLIAQG